MTQSTKTVSARVKPEVAEAMKKKAEKEGKLQSEIVRALVRGYVRDEIVVADDVNGGSGSGGAVPSVMEETRGKRQGGNASDGLFDPLKQDE